VVVHYEGRSNGVDTSAGVKKFQNTNAPKFRSKWRKAFKYHGPEGRNLQLEVDRNVDFRVCMIDNKFPEPNQDAGSYAVVQEIKLLQELGCKVTFVPNNMAHLGSYTNNLQKMGVECIHYPFFSDVGNFLKSRGSEFDLVYLLRYDIAEEGIPWIKKYTRAKILFNNVDLHFLRELRAAFLGTSNDIESSKRTKERETKVMQAVDAILSYNEIEHSIITSLNMRNDNLFICPWVRESSRSKTAFAERNGISFLGGFNHLPNREAVSYFVEKVMPLVTEMNPDIVFNIYGSKVTEDIEAYESENVRVHGFVENLDDIFDTTRILVAPLLSGAGIKGKVVESLACGVPVIGSEIAIEATGIVDGVSGLVARSEQEWAQSIVELYDNNDSWERISAKGIELIDKKYSIESGVSKFSDVFRYLELDPCDSREAFYK
jgi:O-antigen biosynthesis protein